MKNTSRLFQRFESCVNRVSGAGGVVSAVVIFFMALATAYEVIMRYGFNRPTSWTLEVSELLLVFATLIAAPYTLKENGHIRVDILVSRFSEKMQEQLHILSSIIGIVYCVLLSAAGFTVALSLYRRWAVSIVLDIPICFVMIWVGVGGALLAFQFIIYIKKGRTGPKGH